MARSRKSGSSKSESPEPEVTEEVAVVAADTPEPATEPDPDTPAEPTPSEVELAEPDAEPAPESEPKPVSPPPPAPPAETVRFERKGGFVPLLLGGLVAGGIGFGAAAYVIPNYLPSLIPTSQDPALAGEVQDQGAKLQTLESTLAQIQSTPAEPAVPAELTQRIDDLSGKLDALGQSDAALTDRLATLESRIKTLEVRPVTTDPNASAALDAVRQELDGFRAEMAAQVQAADAAKADITSVAEDAAKKIASVEADARQMRAEAEAASRAAALTGSVAQIRAALDSGAAFDGAIADLKAAGIDVPAALSDQAQGAPTLAALRDSFPPAARESLAVSVRETAGTDGWSRITAFFKSQSGARSLTPRAGDDPDAILSRAEAALRAGDLSATLDELKALPEAGQAVMAEWVANAGRRLAAIDAAKSLEQQAK